MDVDSRRWHDRFLTYGVRRTGAGGLQLTSDVVEECVLFEVKKEPKPPVAESGWVLRKEAAGERMQGRHVHLFSKRAP
jgi:hypothetical protein